MRRPPIDELSEVFSAVLATPTRYTTGPGNVGGTSLVDAGLVGAGVGSFFSMMIIIQPGDLTRVDSADITNFDNFTGEITFDKAYKGGQVLTGVPYKIVTFSIIAAIAAVAHSFQEQPDVAVSINAIAGGETDVLNLAVAATRYIVRHLRLKCADPGANTITVRLYELVNDGLVVVDTFAITGGGAGVGNWESFHSLMDMWGLPHLAGDQLQVTVRVSAGADVAVTGQYSFATAT